jgi:trk system potassium uptake protein TrkA
MKVVRQQFAIIGLGIFGRAVAQTLRAMGHEVLGVDASEAVVRLAHDEQFATHAVQADSLNLNALKELEINQYDAVVVAIRIGLEDSILTVHNLTELGVKRIFARAINQQHAKVLERVGGPNVHVVIPEQEMGVRVAQRLANQEPVDMDVIAPHHSFVEVPVPPILAGKTLSEMKLPEWFGVLAVGVRHDGRLNFVPSQQDRVEAHDSLLLFGSDEALRSFGR